MLVDFHSHTVASDGTLPPGQLLAAMRARGVANFSITDHDSLDAYRVLGGVPDGCTVGIELNTTEGENEIHILGYGLPLGDSGLDAVLSENRAARVARVGAIIAKLNAAGIPLHEADVAGQAEPGAALGRPHVAMALVRGGYASSIQSCFDRFLKRGCVAHVPSEHMSPFQAIDVIRRAGGVSVLAHPGRLADYALIERCAAHGLAGLEVFYPAHDPGQVAFFRGEAKRLGLAMSGGSDFHDYRWNARGVGIEVERDDVAEFMALVARPPSLRAPR